MLFFFSFYRYFQDVLESTVLPNDCAEIQLYMDGNWEPLVVNKKEQSCVVDKVDMAAVSNNNEMFFIHPTHNYLLSH